MPSGLDLLDKQSKGPGTLSGLSLLEQPTTELPEVRTDVSELAKQLQYEAEFERKSRFEEKVTKTLYGMTPSELEQLKAEPIITDEFKSGVVDTLRGLSHLAQNPIEIATGAGKFLMGLPGFALGIAGATQKMAEEAIYIDNVQELYDAATRGMNEGTKFWEEKVQFPLGGKPTEAESLVGQTAMAPAMMISLLGHHLANSASLKGHPNLQGMLRFAGDIGGLIALGRLYKGSRAEVATRAEEITKKADTLVRKEERINEIPDEIVKQAQQKVLEVEKQQLELEAKQVMDNLDYGKMIQEDLSSKTSRIKKIRQPQREIADVQVDKALAKLEEGPKPVQEYDFSEPFHRQKVEAIKKDIKAGKKPTVEVRVGDEGEPIATNGLHTLQAYKELGKKPRYETVEEPAATEIDTQTGTREPVQLSTENSPFRETREHTQKMSELYDEHRQAVRDDVEMFSGKLINDVNRWLDGEDIDINSVRDGLSDLAARADELKYDYFSQAEDYPSNFNNWKEMVSEAAEWARRADRLKIEPSVDLNGKHGTKLYSIFPADEAARLLRDTYRYAKGKIVRTVNTNQKELLRQMIGLHTEGKMDADVTFGRGGLWKGTGIHLPKYRFDLNPPNKMSTKADITKRIPLNDESIESAIFDPPFLVESGGGKTGYMTKRFGSFRTIDDLWDMYKKSLAEIFRVLKPGGKLITKTQDITYGDRFWASSSEIYNFAIQQGFKPVDRFIYHRTGGFGLPPQAKRQLHARKAHSDFWVFEKPKKGFTYPKEGGIKLYSGLAPLEEGAKQLAAGAKRLADYTKRARGMKELNLKVAAGALREEFNRAFVDRSGNIRQELLDKLEAKGYEVIQNMYLSKGASSLAERMLKQMRKEVYSGLSNKEKVALDNLILAERMVDIGKYKTKKEFKFPEGLTPVESAAYSVLFPYIEKLSPEQAADIRNRASAYYEWMKKPLQDMLDVGLISEEEFNALSSHNYRRIKLVDIFDKRYQAKVGKRKRTVYDSGVEALARGRDTDVFEPSSEIMALEVFNRAYGRVLNNMANQELLNLARSKPDNPFVRVKTKSGDRIPAGWNRHFVYENGERKAIYLSPEMSQEWIINNPEMSYRLSQLIRFASGSVVLRTFATGINWGFALANLPRDVMHAWYAARVFENGKWRPIYNSNLPIFGLQIGRDLATVFSDAVLRKGRYDQYIKEGGGMEFLVHQGRLLRRGRHLESSLDKVQNFMGYFGETSEIMTRLAIRERVLRQRLKQGVSREKAAREATFAARDYMDFGQGGGIAKALDNGIPYLNAAIQGTRGLVRAFKENPVRSSYKLAQFAALVTGIYIAMQRMHPKSAAALKGNVDMQNNLCLSLGDDFGFEDERGQMRYPYLKIPLDPGQKFFKTFFEAATDKWLGNDVDIDRVVDSLKETSPVGVTELPPSVSGVFGYVTNKDFWLNEDIWRRTDKPFSYPQSKEEYIPGKTPQAYIDVGQATGLSPERMRYAVEELTTNGTIWSYLLGQGYEASFGDLPKSKKEQHLAETLAELPIVRRFFGVTNPYSQYARPIDEAKQKSDIDRWIQTRGLDMRTEAYLYDKSIDRKEVIDYIKSFKDRDVYNRLKDRFEFQEKIKDLPNRAFWLRLRGLTPEARAQAYQKRIEGATPEEREELRKEMATVIRAGGVISKEFREEVFKVRGQ